MSSLWEDQARYQLWLEVELLALKAMAEAGLVPRESYQEVKAKAGFSVERIETLEKELKHDVIAFLSNVAEHAGPFARYLHRGMTSSDLLDTVFALQLVRSGQLILKGLDTLSECVRSQAEKYKHTPCAGRSHGIHAEPITFGLKLISWYAELRRQRQRIERACSEVAVGKISGAVGTYASVPPQVEEQVLGALGLRAETVSTQVVQRDRHAAFFSALALLGCSIERFCVEIRHLQRTEVREVEEEFSKQQKGSSAMPHKRNPVLSENLCGLSRLLRSYAEAAMENVPLWHERDISHSSVERVIAPDACALADFMLHRFTQIVKNLVVHEDRMMENLELTRGLVFSGTLLIKLADKGQAREDAYRVVQRHALAAWEGGPSFAERVRSDKEITKVLNAAELDEIFDLKRHLRHVDYIFNRVLSHGGS